MSDAPRYRCPCCGYLTLTEEPGSYDICPVCWWEDDPIQAADPDYDGGANAISLEQARRHYAQFGASDEGGRDHVRPPRPEEMPPSQEHPAPPREQGPAEVVRGALQRARVTQFKILGASTFSWAPSYRGLHRPWPVPGLGVCKGNEGWTACKDYLSQLPPQEEEAARDLLMRMDPSRVEFHLIGYGVPGRVSGAPIIGYDVAIDEDRSVITDCILFDATQPPADQSQASWRAYLNEYQLFAEVDVARSLLASIQDGSHVASDWACEAVVYAIVGCDLIP